jgi:hypothetical protein
VPVAAATTADSASAAARDGPASSIHTASIP